MAHALATLRPPTWRAPAWIALGLTRIVLGLTFLWAFLDKLLGLTYATPAASAWTAGGHPTKGYLSSSFGPLASVFKAMAGHPVVDTLVMLGLLFVGITLTLGIAVRAGALAGIAMVVMMYASHPLPWMQPHGTHPFLDEHILEAAVLLLLAFTPSGVPVGLGRWWHARVVPKARWLA
jgi:thiosulfate dehydrogenase [quinone] large subunit